MEILFREATGKDFKVTEELTREAFWDIYKPGCEEHFVLHNIRKSESYIRELDLVATEGATIIGHIICTKSKVIDSTDTEHLVLCVGPFSINPEHQKKGYGSKLMEYCIMKAQDLGYCAMILFGNPAYYHRFGFKNAIEYGIKTKDGANLEPFMAKELLKNGLKGIQGKFYEDEVYSADRADLNEFETQFPYREKHILSTQL
jgi:predicted N-acetyltransferase YhbS